MATADQLKMLIKAHFSGKDEQFRTAVLQIAAYESQQGHQKLGRELKSFLEKNSKPKSIVISMNSNNELVAYTEANCRMNDLVVSEDLRARIERILQEFRQREKLHRYCDGIGITTIYDSNG